MRGGVECILEGSAGSGELPPSRRLVNRDSQQEESGESVANSFQQISYRAINADAVQQRRILQVGNVMRVVATSHTRHSTNSDTTAEDLSTKIHQKPQGPISHFRLKEGRRYARPSLTDPPHSTNYNRTQLENLSPRPCAEGRQVVAYIHVLLQLITPGEVYWQARQGGVLVQNGILIILEYRYICNTEVIRPRNNNIEIIPVLDWWSNFNASQNSENCIVSREQDAKHRRGVGRHEG